MLAAVDAILAVEVGAGRIKAALGWPDQGGARVVPFDGQGWLPSEVFVDEHAGAHTGAVAQRLAATRPAGLVAPVPYLTGPDLQVAGRGCPPVDLVAVLVGRVASTVADLVGDVPARVVVAVPAGWGPRRRAALREALAKGGLGQPDLIEAAVAVGQYLQATGVDVPAGTCLAVCDVGVETEATVLRRGTAGFEILATVVADHGGGQAVDAALAAHLTTAHQPPGDEATAGPGAAALAAGALLAAARAAKEELSVAVSALARPEPSVAPVLVTVEQFRDVTAPVTARAAEAVRVAVEAAGVPVVALRWVVCVGGGARMPVLADPIERALGVRPVMAADPDLAVVVGALHTAPSPGLDPDTWAGADPDQHGWWRDVATTLAAATAGIGLYGQFLAGARRFGPAHHPEQEWLAANWGGLAVAAALATLACVVGATLVTAGRHDRGRDRILRHRLVAVSLAAGGMVGLAAAVVAALATASAYELPAGRFLRWAALPALLVAAAVAGTGAVMLRRPEPPPGGWLAWLRFPPAAVVLLGAGELAVGYNLTGVPTLLQPAAQRLEAVLPSTGALLDVITATGRAGAALLGVGVAVLVVRRPWHRLIAGVLLAALPAATLSPSGADSYAAAAAGVVAAWWLWRGLYLLLRPIVLPAPGHPAGPAEAASAPPATMPPRPASGIR